MVILFVGDLNVGILDEKDRKYPMESMDDFNIETIKEFIDSYEVGKLQDIFIRALVMLSTACCRTCRMGVIFFAGQYL